MTDPNFVLRLPPELRNRIESEAKRQDRSKAYIIIKAIEAYLQESDHECSQ